MKVTNKFNHSMERTFLYSKKLGDRLVCKFYKGNGGINEKGLVIYLQNTFNHDSILISLETFTKLIKTIREFDSLGKFLIKEGTEHESN